MRVIAVIAVLAVAGCAGNRMVAPDLLPPEVTLTQIGMRNAGLTGGTLQATVQVRNPNSAVVRGTGINLTLEVQGARFGTTELQHGFELAGDSTATFLVPVDFEWRSVGLAARGVLNTGEVRYVVYGRTYVLWGGDTWRFPYSHEGSVPLVRVP